MSSIDNTKAGSGCSAAPCSLSGESLRRKAAESKPGETISAFVDVYERDGHHYYFHPFFEVEVNCDHFFTGGPPVKNQIPPSCFQ
jgi:hypothetical protein